MKDEILTILETAGKSLTAIEIEEKLGTNDLETLLKELRELEIETLVYHTNKDKYMLFEDSHLLKGVLHSNKKGFGFVDVDSSDVDIYIPKENINGAIHGDLVVVELVNKKSIDRVEGRIVKVLKHESNTYVGEINFKNGVGVVELDEDKVNLKVIVNKENSLNAVDGHKVVVEILKRISNKEAEGKVIKIIGHKNDPGVDILSIVYKYDINASFPEEVEEEVKNLPMEVREEDLKGRRDLRDEVIFTIDGDDTKDIDDAISIKKEDDSYILGVHIADVSYYVKEGSPLDKEAMDRGTSVYLVDRVIPMLPHELSNGICSLNPNVDRLAISCVMKYDKEGKLLDYDIFPSVIRSRIQMTYKKVNSILENNTVPEGYESYVDDLKLMEELALILRKMKVSRGYLDFDVDEAKILVDDNCVPYKITKRERGKGENLIEDFMIAANECVATHIYNMDLPFIYRIHETPKEEKIRDFLSFVSNLGYNVTGDLKGNKNKAVQKLLKFVHDKKEGPILTSLLLRCMQKAVYSPTNVGHFGLGSSCYTHFTSPIRRYPDTTVHRLLRTYLFNHDLSTHTINHYQEKLIFVADHSSAKERASVDCEREVEDMKMAEYMEGHIGEEYEGMISSVMSFGMFVELDNLVEGLVPVRLMDDYFVFDEMRMTLVGEKSKVKYTIGERVLIKVVDANKEAKTIDFKIIKKL
ncbi:MAG TPA: ribonuclease R [Candidatus Onthousia faecavium]|nr:ribonuclease R [Candidatus Onthousia faecavium]